jgi:hypothetical protein
VQYFVDYTERLRAGIAVESATVTATVNDVTIDTIVITEGRKLSFFMAGGSLNEMFTLNIVATWSDTELFNDTMLFKIVAP